MTEPGPISYRPSEGLSYDPADPVYWETQALGQELERTFEVCHGCRLCFKYCDAFPTLFSLLDERHGCVQQAGLTTRFCPWRESDVPQSLS